MSKNLNNVRMVLTSPQTVTSDILDKLAGMTEYVGSIDIQGSATVDGCYSDTLMTLEEKVPNFIITNTGLAYLRINDPVALQLLLGKYDSDSNGVMTQDEADLVKNFGNLFSSKAITSTEWIKFFPNLTTMTGGTKGSLFYGCTSIVDAKFPVRNKVQYLGQVGDWWGGALENCTALKTVDTSDWDTSNVISFAALFRNDSVLATVGDINVTANCNNLQYLFSNCPKLTSLNCTNWVTNNVTRLQGLFSGCTLLTSVGDLSGWNTSKCTLFNDMFYGCSALTSVGDLSGWNVGNATDIKGMFYGTKFPDYSFLNKWNPSKVTVLSGFMMNVTSTGSYVDLSGWTCKITNFIGSNQGFFRGSKLRRLSLRNWDITGATSFAAAFYAFYAEDLNLRGWDTVNSTNVNMFAYSHVDCLRISGSFFNINSRESSPVAFLSGQIGGYLKEIHIYDSIPYLPENMFSGYTNLKIFIHDETVPPTVESLGLKSTAKIFVPAAAVDAYQTAWPTYASQIQGMGTVLIYGTDKMCYSPEEWTSLGMLPAEALGLFIHTSTVEAVLAKSTFVGTYDAAKAYASTYQAGNRTDWKMPTGSELNVVLTALRAYGRDAFSSLMTSIGGDAIPAGWWWGDPTSDTTVKTYATHTASAQTTAKTNSCKMTPMLIF